MEIGQISTRLRLMLKQWRKRSHTRVSDPSDVHLSLVCAGSTCNEYSKPPPSPPSKLRSIRQIVLLRQMLKRWRARAHSSPPSDVPPGHLAVSVGLGSNTTRYVLPTSYLNHPMFLKLLTYREEVCGFSSMHGPLQIPCRLSFFEEIITHIQTNTQPSPSSRFMIGIL